MLGMLRSLRRHLGKGIIVSELWSGADTRVPGDQVLWLESVHIIWILGEQLAFARPFALCSLAVSSMCGRPLDFQYS